MHDHSTLSGTGTRLCPALALAGFKAPKIKSPCAVSWRVARVPPQARLDRRAPARRQLFQNPKANVLERAQYTNCTPTNQRIVLTVNARYVVSCDVFKIVLTYLLTVPTASGARPDEGGACSAQQFAPP